MGFYIKRSWRSQSAYSFDFFLFLFLFPNTLAKLHKAPLSFLRTPFPVRASTCRYVPVRAGTCRYVPVRASTYKKFHYIYMLSD